MSIATIKDLNDIQHVTLYTMRDNVEQVLDALQCHETYSGVYINEINGAAYGYHGANTLNRSVHYIGTISN